MLQYICSTYYARHYAVIVASMGVRLNVMLSILTFNMIMPMPIFARGFNVAITLAESSQYSIHCGEKSAISLWH